MKPPVFSDQRRTTADAVFDELFEQIVSLKIEPGHRLSESDVAAKFGVSRQPVREAFVRLAELGLILVQPQRPTQVCRFSRADVEHVHFLRLCVELEVTSRAAQNWDNTQLGDFEANLAAQEQAVAAHDVEAFRTHDEAFHALLCQAAGTSPAAITLRHYRMRLDRLYALSIGGKVTLSSLLEDHQRVFAAVTSGQPDQAVREMRQHLSSRDSIIEILAKEYPEYFEE